MRAWPMKIIQTCAFLMMSCGVLLHADGTVPRTQVSRYPSHMEIDGTGAGAILLKESEVKQRFAADLNREYLVVEVAVYPRHGEMFDVKIDDFSLRVKGNETALKSENPRIAISLLQQTAPHKRDVHVVPYANIGYESSGIHSYPGYNSGGIYTSTGVGVVLGDEEHERTPQDEEVMVMELTEKSLPEGQTDKPVAGYLYFRVDKKMRQDCGNRYSLEFNLYDRTAALELSN